jgi:hypothetical protein
MNNLRGHKSWKWYGYAGHLIISRDCAYHLNTRVGSFVVSTVGAYYPKGQKEMERIGAGKHDFFETYVFHCMGEVNGDAVVNHSEIDGKRYKNSRKAEAGHYAMCWKWRAKDKEAEK